jgi:hypothetical protein
MSLPTAAIQTGFIARYRADTPLQGLLAGSTAPTWSIYDQNGVPTNQAFPYVVLFPITSQSGTALAFGTDAVDTFMQVSVFTQSGGLAQARAIAKRIYDISQGKALDLSGSGFNQFFLLFDNEQESPELDGITQQIAHRYKLMTTG